MLPRGCKTLSLHENPLRECASALLLTKGEGGCPAATYSNHLTRGRQLCVDPGLAKTSSWQADNHLKKKVLHLIKIKSKPTQYNQMTHSHQFEILNYFNLINDSSLTVKKGTRNSSHNDVNSVATNSSEMTTAGPSRGHTLAEPTSERPGQALSSPRISATKAN